MNATTVSVNLSEDYSRFCDRYVVLKKIFSYELDRKLCPSSWIHLETSVYLFSVLAWKMDKIPLQMVDEINEFVIVKKLKKVPTEGKNSTHSCKLVSYKPDPLIPSGYMYFDMDPRHSNMIDYYWDHKNDAVFMISWRELECSWKSYICSTKMKMRVFEILDIVSKFQGMNIKRVKK